MMTFRLRKAWFLPLAMAALCGPILAAAPAHAATYIGTYELDSAMTPNAAWCLDANTAQGGANGTRVQIWSCNRQDQQEWQFYQVSGDVYNIVNVRYGLCLDADFNHINQNGDQLQLWTCNGTGQQEWIYPNLGTPYFTDIFCYFNSNAVDADISKPFGNGTKVQLWWPNSPTTANQSWVANWRSG